MVRIKYLAIIALKMNDSQKSIKRGVTEKPEE